MSRQPPFRKVQRRIQEFIAQVPPPPFKAMLLCFLTTSMHIPYLIVVNIQNTQDNRCPLIGGPKFYILGKFNAY